MLFECNQLKFFLSLRSALRFSFEILNHKVIQECCEGGEEENFKHRQRRHMGEEGFNEKAAMAMTMFSN